MTRTTPNASWSHPAPCSECGSYTHFDPCPFTPPAGPLDPSWDTEAEEGRGSDLGCGASDSSVTEPTASAGAQSDPGLGIGSGPDQYPDAVAARLGISNSDLWERGIGRDPATLDQETVSMPAYSYTDPDGVVLSSEADLDAAAEPILRLEHDVRTCSPALWNATTTPIAAEMLSRYLGGQRSVEALYLGFTGQLGPASILFRYHHDVGTGPERAWIESYVGSWIAAGMPSIPPRAS